MSEVQGTIVNVVPRRGRGPGTVVLKVEGQESPLSLTTFAPDLLKLAGTNREARATVTWEEKPSKDGSKTYQNLVTMSVDASQTPVQSVQTAPESLGTGGEAISPLPALPERTREAPRSAGTALAIRPQTALECLEQGFALAVRQRELLEGFIRSRFREGEHFMDGAPFGSKKKILLLAGAQLIVLAHGYVPDFEVLGGPLAAPPKEDALYTLALKCILRDRELRIVGAGVGSCSSLIWSGKETRYKPRGSGIDLTHNSTFKIGKKRAYIDACLNTTAASEFFTQDLDEYPKDGGGSEGRPFIRARRR